jgi:hypothetical protein
MKTQTEPWFKQNILGIITLSIVLVGMGYNVLSEKAKNEELANKVDILVNRSEETDDWQQSMTMYLSNQEVRIHGDLMNIVDFLKERYPNCKLSIKTREPRSNGTIGGYKR